MNVFVRNLLLLFSISVGLFQFIGCLPVPDSQLSLEQKEADMKWIYSMFDENYAPLDYKVKRYGFDYQALKESTLEVALQAPTNEGFYHLVHLFVSQFKDGHTTGTFSHGGLPNRAFIASLGISGKRKGNHFVVTDFLSAEDPRFPIKKGDEISQFDGQALPAYIKAELVLARDTGQEESNLTYHMNRVFNRSSLEPGFPTHQDATLTIVKREYTAEERRQIEEREHRKLPEGAKKSVNLQVTLPWIAKDMFHFKRAQPQALAAVGGSKVVTDWYQYASKSGSPVTLALRRFDGSIQSPFASFLNPTQLRRGARLLKSFYFPNQIERWVSRSAALAKGAPTEEETSVLQQFKENRAVPSDAFFVTAADAFYPTYVSKESVGGPEGDRSKARLVATMYLNTFSPEGPEAKVMSEFYSTLAKLQTLGVKDIVIDMLNNGGGSLGLGMKLAQALSNQKVVMPAIQLRNSNTWRDEFLGTSLGGAYDAERVLAHRVYLLLQKEARSGNRLSSPISAESLLPFELTPNVNLVENFNIAMMTNEMCASMCDIFSAILKDNQMGITVGSKTMGAGGNVVNHFFAPNSHLILRQTESLMIRNKKTASGSELTEYIENNGIEPDFAMSVTEYSDTKYKAVRQRAVDALLEAQASAPAAPAQIPQAKL